MKKRLLFFASLLMVLIMMTGFLCACGDTATDDSNQATVSEAETEGAEAEEPTTAVADDGVTLSND